MSLPQSRIAELAATVASHTARIDSYLAEAGLPHPSFEADGPVDLKLPPHIETSRTTVLQASQELNDLLQEPRDLLFNHQHNSLVYLDLISRFNIAQHVSMNEEVTYAELESKTGIDSAALCRILRFGIANRIFQEPRPGVIAHSAASKLIAEDSRVADWVGANVGDMWPSARKLVDALVKWPHAAEPNQTGFSLANDSSVPFYAELAKDPARARRFGGSGTIVDLGGSHGDAASAIARKFPELHLIVQELPEVVTDSKEETGLNVKFITHDFFEEQPIKDADVYLYRWILHNWPDKYCLRILRALIPALKEGSRILIMDFVMPPLGVLPNDVERKLRAMDLTMLEIGNAKERDLDEWKCLLAEADTRFIFKRVTQPSGSALGIIEVSWEE